MNRMAVGMLAALIMMGGCTKTTEQLDAVEIRDPLLRKALAKEREGDRDAALVCLSRALDKKPRLAQAHLRIALLYDDYRKDYVRAVYHYERYLELRSDTEKREMIEGRIRDAQLSFGATLANRPVSIDKEYRSLRKENARLKKALRQVRIHLAGRLAASSASASQAGTSGGDDVAGPLPAADAPPGRVYIVQPNDTLSTIAAAVYKSPGKWRRIYDANRGVLGDDPDGLEVGQVLIIPK